MVRKVNTFWSRVLLPEEKHSFTVTKFLQISSATIDINSINTLNDDNVYPVLVHIYDEDLILCNLTNQVLYANIDLLFAEGTELTLYTTGKATVHLTGYTTIIDYGYQRWTPGVYESDYSSCSDQEEYEEAKFEILEEKNLSEKRMMNMDQIVALKKSKSAAHAESSIDKDDDEWDIIDTCDLGDLSFSDGGKKVENIDKDITDERNEKKNLPEVESSKNNELTLKTLEPRKIRTLRGGLIVEELKTGNGPIAKPGDKVVIYYTERLKNSNRIIDEINSGPGWTFRVGSSCNMICLNLALNGMKVGSIRRITSPSKMTFDSEMQYRPQIRKNQVLVMDIELKRVN